MRAVLQLVVQRREAEGHNAAMLRQLHTTHLGDVVVEVVVQTWRHQLVVQQEVGDAQLQQRARLGDQLVTVYDVVAVEGAEEDMTVGQCDGGILRTHRVVHTVQIREGGENLLLRIKRAEDVVGGKPYVALVVECQAANLLRGQTGLDAEVLKLPAPLGVLVGATTQTTAVGTYPHVALLVSAQTDDVVAGQSLLQIVGLLQGVCGKLVILQRHDKDAVGGTCPHLALLVDGNGAHLLV